ncbi:Dynein regulatory complex protein 9 like protein [Aduncisulcus paluster]|uniref:Dynein regulatory complex protein 9 like protein n=1 Tax=Aduncisulcus paluster TaxID=2918883 RepID=A0ABQ5KBH2_9EUKA|nr:Dynein regulatory complex protein 9 like protein [Aduncisulcus paluster]
MSEQAYPKLETIIIKSLLGETVEKFNFLELIAPDVLSHHEELSEYVGEEMSRIIQHQRKLETEFESLAAKRAQLTGVGKRVERELVQKEIDNISKQLKQSTKILCKNLKDNPNVSVNLLKVQKHREELQRLLASTLSEIEETEEFKHLQEIVEEELEKYRSYVRLMLKEKESSEKLRALQAEIDKTRDKHAEAMKAQAKNFESLRLEMTQTRKETAERSVLEARTADGAAFARERSAACEAHILEQRVLDLQRRVDREEIASTLIQDHLTQVCEKLSLEIERWEARNEKYSTELRAGIEDIIDKKTDIQGRISALKSQISDEEQAKVEAKRESKFVESMEKARSEAIKARHSYALIKMQKLWHEAFETLPDDLKKQQRK